MSVLDDFRPGHELDDFFSNDDIEDLEERMDAQAKFDALPRREKEVVLYHCLGYTQAEIGDLIGYSQQRICQILKSISNLA